jgi:hypothetical protein
VFQYTVTAALLGSYVAKRTPFLPSTSSQGAGRDQQSDEELGQHNTQRDSATRFSTSGFFHESVSHKPLPLGPFRIFRNLAEIFADTNGKGKKSSIRKVLIIILG